jgi:hypothetical protein
MFPGATDAVPEGGVPGVVRIVGIKQTGERKG